MKCRHLFALAAILVLVLVAMAQAADKTIQWDAVPDAIGYRISISTDAGVTWTQAAEIPAGTTEAVITIPDTGLTLIRASAYNNIGEAVNTTGGVWYNPDWKLTETPIGLRTPDRG